MRFLIACVLALSPLGAAHHALHHPHRGLHAVMTTWQCHRIKDGGWGPADSPSWIFWNRGYGNYYLDNFGKGWQDWGARSVSPAILTSTGGFLEDPPYAWCERGPNA